MMLPGGAANKLGNRYEKWWTVLEFMRMLPWSMARRGVFYRPVKQQITLRLDADIVAWFKKHARDDHGYQAEINRALRRHVQHAERVSET